MNLKIIIFILAYAAVVLGLVGVVGNYQLRVENSSLRERVDRQAIKIIMLDNTIRTAKWKKCS